MTLQRVARFFLWSGLGLLCLGLLGGMISCGAHVAEFSRGNELPEERNVGAAVSILLIIFSLLFVAIGSFLKALAGRSVEYEE